MKKSYIVDSTCNDMRIDRWIRNFVGKIPQGLIEKNLRAGKIKLNKKKIKSSYKIKTGDKIKIDLNNSRIDLLVSNEEIKKRKENTKLPILENQTPWQEISRKMVGQLETGSCLETETVFLDITNTKGMPRHSH